MYQHLLVPHDGTPLSFATVEQAVSYAKAVGAQLTFVHARPDVAASSEGALLHAMSPQALLDELEQQHVAGAKQFAAMGATLDAGDMPAFAQQVRTFAQQQWHHMSTEEKLMPPAAGRFLTAEDWREIAQAFGSNGDLRFGTGESFESLASRLLEMAAHAPRGSFDPRANP